MCEEGTGSQDWDLVSLYGKTISKFSLLPGYQRFGPYIFLIPLKLIVA